MIRRMRKPTLMLLALVAVLVALPMTATAQAPKLHFCRNVDGTVAVGEQRVACAQARAVAIAFIAGKRPPAGFHCRRIAVNAAAGFYGVCTKRAQLVRVIPE